MASGKMRSVTPSKNDNKRKYSTGACRSDSSKKLNFIKALSPLVLKEYVDYIRSFNVKTIKGEIREEDNWKLGIPRQDYLESAARHFMDIWLIHEGYIEDKDHSKIIRCLCAVLFNMMGYLHTLLVERLKKKFKRTLRKNSSTVRFSNRELQKIVSGEMSREEIKKIIKRRKK